MVIVPSLFAAFPGAAHPVLMGTNKLASAPGLAIATWRYAVGARMPWRIAIPVALAYSLTTIAGVYLSRGTPTAIFKLLVPLMLSAMLAYVLLKRDFGLAHAPRPARRTGAAIAMGATMGVYEGFFGPGSGTLLIFAFVRVFGFDFMHASAAGKLVNFAGCATAAAVFGLHGEAMIGLAAGMAACYLAGAWIGAHMAIARGSRWLRGVFVVVATLLIARTAWDSAKPFLG